MILYLIKINDNPAQLSSDFVAPEPELCGIFIPRNGAAASIGVKTGLGVFTKKRLTFRRETAMFLY